MVLWELSRVPGSSPGVLRGSHGTMGAQPILHDSPSTMGARASPFPWYYRSSAGFLGAQPGSWELRRVPRGSHGTMGAQPVPRGSPGTMEARVSPFPWYLGSTAGFLEAHPGSPWFPWYHGSSTSPPWFPWYHERSGFPVPMVPWEHSRVPGSSPGVLRGSHGTMGAQPIPRDSPSTMGARASPFPWYYGSSAGFLEAHPGSPWFPWYHGSSTSPPWFPWYHGSSGFPVPMVPWEHSRVPGSSPGFLRGSHGTMGAQPIPCDSPSTMGARASPFPWYYGSSAGFLGAQPGSPWFPWHHGSSTSPPWFPWYHGSSGFPVPMVPWEHSRVPGSSPVVLRGSHGTMGAQPIPRDSPSTMGAGASPFPWYYGSSAGSWELSRVPGSSAGFPVVPMV